jgi:hypothetical protein
LIKNKRYFFIAFIPFIASMVLNFPFPDLNPYGETVVSVLNVPVKTVNGINYVGMASLFLLIVSLYFLWKSLGDYRKRSVVIAIILATFIPSFLAISFQKTLATGIYAIAYEHEKSHCRFEMTNKTTLHGVCTLPFENYSNADVKFSLEFNDQDDIQMESLMNNNAPYEVKLRGNKSEIIKIETNIDVSKMKNHIDGGEANGINIVIKSGGKSRKL